MFVRHLLSIAILPFTVTVLVPWWLARRDQIQMRVGGTIPELLVQLAGMAALGLGITLFSASLRQFVVKGRGTLAPWDPPKHLVVEGPYRYVRNPMISGVVFILAGESLILLSRTHAAWLLIFLCMNLIYIPLLEEPVLETRFGDAYRMYRRHVRMIIPRVRPWTLID